MMPDTTASTSKSMRVHVIGKDLFRQEVLDNISKRLEGEVVLGMSPPWALAGYLAVAFVVLVFIFASTATYTRQETAVGALIPDEGIIRVPSPGGGIVKSIAVHEGDDVTSGEVLAMTDPTKSGPESTSEHERLTSKTAIGERIVSPVAGVIAAIPIDIGQTVSPGSTLFIMLPKGSRIQAELFVPARSIGFIRVGQEVSLQYQSFPFQRFGSAKGKITSISRTVLAPSDLPNSAVPLREPSFRVKVALQKDYMLAYGHKQALEPGMSLTARIVVERESLIHWALDPLYAAGRRS